MSWEWCVLVFVEWLLRPFLYILFILFVSLSLSPPVASRYFHLNICLLFFQCFFSGWQTNVSIFLCVCLYFYYYNFVTQFDSIDMHTLVLEVFALVSHQKKFRRNNDFCKWKTFVVSMSFLLYFCCCCCCCSISISPSPMFILLHFFIFYIFFCTFVGSFHHTYEYICIFYSPQSIICHWNVSNEQNNKNKQKKQQRNNAIHRNECNQTYKHTRIRKKRRAAVPKCTEWAIADDKKLKTDNHWHILTPKKKLVVGNLWWKLVVESTQYVETFIFLFCFVFRLFFFLFDCV